jgi:hypothetical protein
MASSSSLVRSEEFNVDDIRFLKPVKGGIKTNPFYRIKISNKGLPLYVQFPPSFCFGIKKVFSENRLSYCILSREPTQEQLKTEQFFKDLISECKNYCGNNESEMKDLKDYVCIDWLEKIVYQGKSPMFNPKVVESTRITDELGIVQPMSKYICGDKSVKPYFYYTATPNVLFESIFVSKTVCSIQCKVSQVKFEKIVPHKQVKKNIEEEDNDTDDFTFF